jgi:hypothetical protein
MTRILCILSIVLAMHIRADGQVVINEFMASNHGSFFDSLGQTSDWIELYNAGSAAVQLEGWSLSDEHQQPGKWVFPVEELEPGAFLLVFASGDDIYDGYYHHTNFRLNASGEEILLTDPDGNAVDLVEFGEQFPDISRGRLTDAGQDFYFFDPGTPGYSNAGGDTVQPVSPDIRFSAAPGFYKDPLYLILTASEEDLDIYYTLNGEAPSPSALQYNAPILLKEDNMPDVYLSHIPTGIGWRMPEGEVNQCHVIRAQAFRDGEAVGRERKGTYFIESKGDDRYEMPVMSIITDPHNLFDPDSGIYFVGLHENYFQRGDEWERLAHVEYFDDGDLVLFQDLGIRITGGASRLRPQKSLKLYARSEYGETELDYPFFGSDYGGDFKRITLRSLRNNWTPTGISDDVCHEISHQTDLDFEYQRRRFAVVFINGEYWGVHSLRESTDEFLVAKKYDLDHDDIIIDGLEWEDLKEYAIQNDMTDPQHYEYVISQIDISSVMDYYVAELFFANYDWPNNNNKAWKTSAPDSRWRQIFFDLDGGMRQYKHSHFRMFFEPEELHINRDRFPGFEFFRHLLQNEAFRDLFKSSLIYHLNNSFKPTKTTDILYQVKEEFEDEISEHQRRWHYPNSIRRWRHSIENSAGFLILRPDILLTEVFLKLGQPIDIFPNPVLHDACGELELGSGQAVNFYLSGMNGVMIYLGEIDMLPGKNPFCFDMSGYSNGMYVLTAVTGQQMFYSKIVIGR